MNKINRKVEYALVALKHMRAKAPGELTTVKELTVLYGCPFEITSRVMQALARKGLLRSTAGAHGGYQLTKDLHRVSFYELNEMLLGPMAVAKCLQHVDVDAEGCGMRETCNIVSPVQTLSRKLGEFYKALSLAELLETRSSGARAAATVPDVERA